MNHRAIGIFDSGVGGLSVAKAVNQLLPNENLLYVADSFYAPYGEMDLAQLKQRVLNVVQFLVQQQVKAIVVACNTATVNIINVLRTQFSIPIVGIEPGIKPAYLQTKRNIIGVLATESTINSDAFKKLSMQFEDQCQIITQPCPEFVHLVEQGGMGSTKAKMIAESYITPLLTLGCDQLVLGCTHFPFLRSEIQSVVNGRAQLIDTSSAVAKQLQNVLNEKQLLTNNQQTPIMRFYSTDNIAKATTIMSRLWQQEILVSGID